MNQKEIYLRKRKWAGYEIKDPGIWNEDTGNLFSKVMEESINWSVPYIIWNRRIFDPSVHLRIDDTEIQIQDICDLTGDVFETIEISC